MQAQTFDPQSHARPERLATDLRIARLAPAGGLREASIPQAAHVGPGGALRRLPILSAKGTAEPAPPRPAVDYLFFREPLKADAPLLERWAVAATAGSASDAWSAFVGGISARFFKGSLRQRVMDALILSLDILPPQHRADALACLLADGPEGVAAVEEFWKYFGLKRIPEVDRARVAALLLHYEIGK
ncbi:hypothetical protein [Pandoraea oxalativorans]|uniref:hypothetical protein n=1 Tax=Pandoraea oxalativorans TaxID=573737 RepID=UPI00069639FD|nr:hypothetical protein [Pandoraea oxalativorans]